ncbi:MAG: IPT/TIG domain-containing protein [bacterium]|nr:IPT/TIG domain-containing protein [bacterium]
MNTKNIFSKTLVFGLLALAALPMTAMAATPTVASILPASVITGSSGTTLVVNGTNFDANAVVNFNGSARTTTYVSNTQLTAAIPASDFSTAGTFSVTVTNPSAGGGTSGTTSLTVANVIPATSSISPSSVASGGAAFTLTVNGSNFIPGSVVNVGGSARTTTYISSTQLTASMSAAHIANAGAFNVTVVNPGPGGGTSNAQILSITGNNPFPTITSISPMSSVAGSGNFTMTVNGSNFNSNSVVRFNGLPRTTTFVSSTQLTAFIPASDSAMSGGYVVYVQNPLPGGGNSNSILFTVAPITGTPQLPDTGFNPGDEATTPMAVAIALIAIAGTAVLAARHALSKR